MQGRAVAARQAHNLKVAGSSPASATNLETHRMRVPTHSPSGSAASTSPRSAARTPIALALAAVLAVSGPAFAQTLPGWTSGLLVSYNLADVEAADPLTGFAAEVDFRFGGLPISFVGHVSSTDPQSFTGAGLRITTTWAPWRCSGTTCSAAQDGQRRDRRGGPAARRRGERPDQRAAVPADGSRPRRDGGVFRRGARRSLVRWAGRRKGRLPPAPRPLEGRSA